MARPKRYNADYFSHDSGMRDDPKVKALRNKFGIVSYKREILVKIDNAYTNNIDKLLGFMNNLVKDYKVSYRGIKGDVLESLRDSEIEDMSFFCYDSFYTVSIP